MTVTRTDDRTRDRGASGTTVAGRATANGTRRFASRFANRFAADFYRLAGPAGLSISSIGMGTYLGECDDREDDRYTAVLAEGISAGLNLLDTAINYRCQRSERAVGRAIRQAIAAGEVARDEIVVCTKGGYVPLDGTAPASRDEYGAYLKEQYFDRDVMSGKDVVGGGHCLRPRFLADQIERSRSNIGVDCIDVFYVHNPEQQLDVLGRKEFLQAIRDAFVELESQVQNGTIGMYGCATWSGFRVFAANRDHLSLGELLDIACDVGGSDHHFRIIQLPVNLAMTEAVRAPTQQLNGKNVSILSAARDTGIAVMASASLMQSQLTHDLPAAVRSEFPFFDTDAQRAIAFVRSLSLTSALVGMRSPDHLAENLAAGRPVTPA